MPSFFLRFEHLFQIGVTDKILLSIPQNLYIGGMEYSFNTIYK